MKEETCLICNNKILIKDSATFSRHIRKEHNTTSKEYYDKYLKTEGEEFCFVCGGINKFYKISKGYSSVCCKKCKTSDIYKQHIQYKFTKTCLEKYGFENPMQNEAVKCKGKQTNIKKYGVENQFQSEHIKNKIKMNNIEKYGVEYYSQSDNYNDKVKQTNLERYGVEYYSKSERFKTDNISKYGSHYYTQTKEFQEKQYITKKINKSFNTSKKEDELYKYLVEKYTTEDVIRQYKSEEYSFNCDFYIKSKKLYIEYQGTWTHGKEPFDNNNKRHQVILEKWINKSLTSDYYKNAIKVWTVTDVLKRKIASQNSLNYIEIFDSNWETILD